MVSSLTEHLENIKIFTDFKKSGFDSIDDFWDSFGEKGNSNLEFFEYAHEEENRCPPPDNKLDDAISLDKNVSRNRDLCDEYVVHVENSIEKAIDENHVQLPNRFPLGDIYEEIILRCGNIEKYLATTEKFVNEYTTLAKGMPARDFFSFLGKRQRGEIEIKFVKKTVEVFRENPRPRIFKDLQAFLLFESWTSEKKSDSDISYVFRRMKEDNLIYGYVGENEFIEFLIQEQCTSPNFSKLKSLHTISDRDRKSRYETLKQLYRND